MADWSKLPYDIIQMIAIQLDAVEDFVAFSAVCKSWRLVYLAKQWTPGSQVPWLMLSDNGNNKRTFFSLYKTKEYELELPEARELEMPLLEFHINLPATIHFEARGNWYNFIDKAIVIKKSKQIPFSNKDLLVMTIYGPFNQLAFTRPGYDSWIMVHGSSHDRFLDIAYVNGQIYALCGVGALVLVEVDSESPKVEFVAPPPHLLGEQLFLVESSADLLMVYQYIDVNVFDSSDGTIRFDVYEFDFDAKEWNSVEDLGDRALFVGDNYCMSADASKFSNCRGNSIYIVGS